MTYLIAILLLSLAPAAGATDVTVTGYITDTMCGRRGANAKHIEHAKRAVAPGKAKYALYDETSRRLYILDPQQTAEAYLGQRVRVTGTLGPGMVQSAGQSFAPDAVATYRNPDGTSRPVNATSGSATAPTTPRVQSHATALDSTTPVEGLLTISSIGAADPPKVQRRTVTC